MPSPTCGQFVYLSNLPLAANRSISDNAIVKAVTASDIKGAMMGGGSSNSGLIYFEDATIDDAAAIEFADCIGRSSTMNTLVLRGCKMSSPSWSALFGGLVENTSISEIHFESCGLGEEQVKEMAVNLIPWNRSISTLNLCGNSALGLNGVCTLVNALSDATSGIQRLSVKRCGVSDGAPVFCSLLLDVVPNLVALYQLDFIENDVLGKPGFSLDAVEQVDKSLRDNYVANGYDDPEDNNKPLMPLVMMAMESIKRRAAEAQASAPGGKSSSTKGSTPVRRGSPAPTSSKSSVVRRGSPAPSVSTPQVKRGQSPVRARSPAPKEAASSRPTTPSSAQRTKSPNPALGSVARSQSMNRNASPARSVMSSSRPPVQHEVDEGYEEWKRVRDEYNRFIRAEGPVKTQPIHVTKYKYAFGKNVDKAKERPSSTFVHTHNGRVREPLPAERRKLAESMMGDTANGKKYIFTDEKNPQGAKIVVVDGGDVTSLNDDPRDMGYMARKMERGEIQRNSKTGGFASNTPRVCRWGVDGTSGVLRHAQAPGPGTYCVRMDWEVKLDKLRASSRSATSSGKRLFGSSGEERRVFHVKQTDTPGPGEYEIP